MSKSSEGNEKDDFRGESLISNILASTFTRAKHEDKQMIGVIFIDK